MIEGCDKGKLYTFSAGEKVHEYVSTLQPFDLEAHEKQWKDTIAANVYASLTSNTKKTSGSKAFKSRLFPNRNVLLKTEEQSNSIPSTALLRQSVASTQPAANERKLQQDTTKLILKGLKLEEAKKMQKLKSDRDTYQRAARNTVDIRGKKIYEERARNQDALIRRFSNAVNFSEGDADTVLKHYMKANKGREGTITDAMRPSLDKPALKQGIQEVVDAKFQKSILSNPGIKEVLLTTPPSQIYQVYV